MKNAFTYLILIPLVISCSIESNNPQEGVTETIIDTDHIEVDDDAEKSESKSGYWEQIKTWTSKSYGSSKTWVTKNWPDAKNWGKDVIEKIDRMATDLGDDMENVEINVFSLEDDKRFGKELYDEIHHNNGYSVLDRDQNPNQYEKIETIIQDILNTGEVEHASDFDWTLTIIDEKENVNAMCAPGGYIFVYTGLLDFTQNDSELAGVLAHEIAHADKRHSTRQLTTVFGVQLLISFLTEGDTEVGAQIAAGLINLKHSRDHERQADEYSVKYLCNSNYDADGVGQFFSNFEEQEGNMIESLISSHPNHKERIENVKKHKTEFSCH